MNPIASLGHGNLHSFPDQTPHAAQQELRPPVTLKGSCKSYFEKHALRFAENRTGLGHFTNDLRADDACEPDR